MLKRWILNVIGECAKKLYNYSNLRLCFFLFYQEELPKEALLNNEKKK